MNAGLAADLTRPNGADGGGGPRAVPPTMGGRVRSTLVWGLVTVSVVATAAVQWLGQIGAGTSTGIGTTHEDLVLLLAFVATAVIGALIVSRRAGNVIGWILVTAGASLPLVLATDAFAVAAHAQGHLTGPVVFAAWIVSWFFLVPIVLLFVLLPLLFPDGRLPSPRWRVPVTVLVGLQGILVLLYAVRPGPLLGVDGPGGALPDNPVGIGSPGGAVETATSALEVAFLPLLAVIIAAVGMRWRRSRGVQRQQMKWFFAGFGALAGGWLLWLALPIPDRVYEATWVAVPATIGMAIMRYRLYDIDRIISRTVAYAVLTVMLVGIYVAGVLGLGGLVRAVTGGGGGDLVVAASTLGVAAAFGPLRRRVQTLVNGRFNRRRYDARQTIDEFTQGLRDEVDLDALAGDLVHVAGHALQPSMIGLWLRPEATS
jgi:hypothetical protein